MDLFILLLNLGMALVMAFQANFYFNSVFGKEKSKPAKWLYILVFIISYTLYITVALPFLLSHLAFLAVILCLSLGYEVNLQMKLVFSALYGVLLMLVNRFFAFWLDPSLNMLSEESVTMGEGYQLFHFMGFLLGWAVMLAVIQIIRIIAKRSSYPLNIHYFLLFFSVPLISAYQVNVLTIYGEKNIHYFLALFGFIVLIILVVYVFDTVTARFQLQHENAQLQHQMDYQDDNYEKTVHSFKKIKSIIHDTNQQLLYVDACIKQGMTAEATEHIRVTLNKVEDAYHRINTGNLVIDALVTNALNISQANGIALATELRLFDRELPIQRYDLCVVLGNLLDNAIEASKKIKIAEDRQIFVHIRSSEVALFIRVRNQVEREVTDLRSQKANSNYHGFGLTNIGRICEKYGGHMTIETASQQFENMVVLPFAEIGNSRA